MIAREFSFMSTFSMSFVRTGALCVYVCVCVHVGLYLFNWLRILTFKKESFNIITKLSLLYTQIDMYISNVHTKCKFISNIKSVCVYILDMYVYINLYLLSKCIHTYIQTYQLSAFLSGTPENA